MSTATMNRTTVSTPPSADAFSDAPHSKAVMRQTQALMGVVLLAGIAGAYFVSMAWLVVPVVVGAGLVFAGVSGMCPMASLIARMPWNKPDNANRHASSGDCCGGRCA